jgi:hypothetical protein
VPKRFASASTSLRRSSGIDTITFAINGQYTTVYSCVSRSSRRLAVIARGLIARERHSNAGLECVDKDLEETLGGASFWGSVVRVELGYDHGAGTSVGEQLGERRTARPQ